MEKSWVDKMVERETLPRQLRKETIVEFCQENGIGENTYYYQARKKENQEKIIEISLRVAKSSVPEVLKVLVDKAEKGDMKAIDTYLDSVVKIAKNLDITSGGKTIEGITYVQPNNNSTNTETA